MEIAKAGMAGTLESCDASVTVRPLGPGDRIGDIALTVESSEERFAPRVREAALSALAELGVIEARVTVRDRSALDCVIRARVLAACLRAAGTGEAVASAPWDALR